MTQTERLILENQMAIMEYDKNTFSIVRPDGDMLDFTETKGFQEIQVTVCENTQSEASINITREQATALGLWLIQNFAVLPSSTQSHLNESEQDGGH